jgi:phosphate transport system protein
MPDKHLSSQFDNELNSVSSRLMEMGGLVESQIQQAVYALSLFVENVADVVIENEQNWLLTFRGLAEVWDWLTRSFT